MPGPAETITRTRDARGGHAGQGVVVAILEFTRFRTHPSRQAALLAARPAMVAALRTGRPGFRGASLVQLDTDEWLDLVVWEAEEDARTSAALGNQPAAVAAFFAAVDEVLGQERGLLVGDGWLTDDRS